MKCSNQHLKTEMSVLLMVLMLCFSTTASADQGYAGGLAEPCRVTWEVAPEISHITYTEPGVMKDKGYMYGVGVSFICHAPLSKPLFNLPDDANTWMLRADARFSYGEVDYDGSLMDGTPYEIHDIEDSVLEYRGLVGYDFRNEVARTTPYTGFGYRYLRDDTSFDPTGYERESNYLYLPVGFEIGLVSDSEWSFGATIEYDFLIRGKQKSHLGDSYGTIENVQHHGRCFRASLRIQKTQPGLDFGIEPFVRLWSVGDSEVSDDFIEPKNRSTEVGVKLVWSF